MASAKAELHQAVSDAVYLRSPDAAGVVALLLRQGPRVDAEDEKTYVEVTGLHAQLAQVLEDAQSPAAARLAPLLRGGGAPASSRKQLEAAMAHAIFLRVAEPVELMAHLADAAVQAGEARMEELMRAGPDEYVQKTELDTKLAAAMDASGLRSGSPPPDVLQRLADALAPRKPETKKSNGSGAPSSGDAAAAASHRAETDTAQLQLQQLQAQLKQQQAELAAQKEQHQAELAAQKAALKQAEEKLTTGETELVKKQTQPKQAVAADGVGGGSDAPAPSAAADASDGAMSALIDGLVQQVLASAKEARDFKELAWATHVVGVGSGAKILDVKDSTGHTALLHATKKPPHAAAIRRLLEVGADKTIKDPNGRTAAMLAAASGNAEVEKVFDAFMDDALEAPPPAAEGKGGDKEGDGGAEERAEGADKEAEDAPADSGKGTGALIVDSGTGEMKLMAVVSLGKSGVQLHELGKPVKMEEIEAADKKIKKNTTSEVAVAGSGWSQEAKDPSTMTVGFRTITKTFGDAIDQLQNFPWFEKVEWTDAFIGATEWYRKLIDDSAKDGSDRGAKATAFLDDLAAWLTEKLNKESIMQRVRVEKISAENEAQYEYRAVEYAVKRSGLPKQIAMMGMGSGSIQLVGFDTKISFRAPLKDGEAMLTKAGSDATQRAKAISQWTKTVRDSFNESSNSLTSLIMEAAQQKDRASKVRLVMISGAYYAGTAAKIATKPPEPYKYQNALECNEKLEALREAPPKADDKDGNKNAANAARLLAILDGLFEGHAGNVEYLFARDWVLDGIKFRTTWAAGWFLESLVRSKFKDGDGKQDAGGGAKRRAVTPFGALAVDVLPKRLTMSCVLLRPDASLEVHEVASTEVEGDMAKIMHVAQTDFWMVDAQLLQPVIDGVEEVPTLAERKEVPLMNFQQGVFRKAEFLNWLEHRPGLSEEVVKKDLAMAAEFLLKLRTKINGAVCGLSKGKGKDRQQMPCRPLGSDHFLPADKGDFSLTDAARLEEAAVHFALLKNGQSKCDAVLTATEDDLVLLMSSAAKQRAGDKDGGVAAIQTNVAYGGELCERGDSTAGETWKKALESSFHENATAVSIKAELSKLSHANRPMRMLVSGKSFHKVALDAKVVAKGQPKPQYLEMKDVVKKLDESAISAAFQKRFGPPLSPNQASAKWLHEMLQISVGGEDGKLDNVRCLVAREWTVDGEIFVPTWVAGWALGLKPPNSARTVHDHTLNLVGDEPEMEKKPATTAMVPGAKGRPRGGRRSTQGGDELDDMGDDGPPMLAADDDVDEFEEDDDEAAAEEEKETGMSDEQRKKLEDATIENIDFRLGILPDQVKMFGPKLDPKTKEQEKDGETKQLLWEQVPDDDIIKHVKQSAGSSYFHLVVPKGHFLEIHQNMRSGHVHPYWTVAIDIRYTYTGEGGGFPVYTGRAGVRRGEWDFGCYVRNFDGKLSSEKPPASPDEIKPDPERNELHKVEEMYKQAQQQAEENTGSGKLSADDEKLAKKIMEDAKAAHLEDAKRGSQKWHRITLTYSSRTRENFGYRNGQQEGSPAFRSSYMWDDGFSLFYSRDPKYVLHEAVEVRLVTIHGNKGMKSAMDAAEVYSDNMKRNTDLNEAMVQTLLREKELRESLYIPSFLADQAGRGGPHGAAASRRVRQLLSPNKSPPAIWCHQICSCAFFIQDRTHDHWNFQIFIPDYLKDFLTFIRSMLAPEEQGGLPDFMQKQRTDEFKAIYESCTFIRKMFMVNYNSLRRRKTQGDDTEDAKAGQKQEQASPWEEKQRIVGGQLQRIKSLHEADPFDETGVHFLPFFPIPNVVHLVIMTESAAQLAYNLKRHQVVQVKRIVDALNKIIDEDEKTTNESIPSASADVSGGNANTSPTDPGHVGVGEGGAAAAGRDGSKTSDVHPWLSVDKFLVRMRQVETRSERVSVVEGADVTASDGTASRQAKDKPLQLSDLQALRDALEEMYKRDKHAQLIEFDGDGTPSKPLMIRKHVNAKVRSYRCVVINQGAEREYHAKLPTGQEVLYNSHLELKAVPKERMESEMWWNMLLLLLSSSGEVFALYKQLLPWLVQKPLTEVHQANQEDALKVHPQFACWLPLQANAKENICFTHMGLIQYMLLVRGHSRQDVDWFYFCFRYFLLSKTVSDLKVLKKYDGMVSPMMMRSVQAVVAQVSLEAADTAKAAMAEPGQQLPPQKWRQWHHTVTETSAKHAKSLMNPKVLHTFLKETITLREMLKEVEQLQRPAPPKLLSLSEEAKQATCQHVFWDAARLAGVDTTSNEIMGESTLDKDMSGLLGLRVFEKELYDIKKDFTGPQAALHTSQVLKQTLEVALQLSNLSDAKWGAHMTAALLSNVFLKVLPMPKSGSAKGTCVWQRQIGADTMPEHTVSYITTTLSRLMEVLAQAASLMATPSRPTGGPGSGHQASEVKDHGGAEAFHPELLLISGTIAAITDAVCRRDQNEAVSDRQAGQTGAIRATLLTRLLCGVVDKLPGEDDAVVGDGRNTYGISIRSFETRTANLRFLFYHHYLARTAIIDYFRGLELPTCNYLFEFEHPAADQEGAYNPNHGLDKSCATWRFFKRLGQGIYSRVTKAIHDPNGDLEAMGAENIAFRNVMVYFKIFVLTADVHQPFHLPTCKDRLQFRLTFYDGEYITRTIHPSMAKTVLRKMAYCVVISAFSHFVHINPELETDPVALRRQGIEIPSRYRPIRKPRMTASDVEFHTKKVRSGDAEDDILHIRRLPEFEGLQPSSVERLLQYLTVPYLRVPLIIDFFSSQNHISALKDAKLRDLVEAAIFESSTYLPNDASVKVPDKVPSHDAEQSTATRYGVLINEIAQSGARLLVSITRLISLALTFDTYDIDGSMASVILFLSRIAVDIEMAASMLMAREDNQMVLSLAPEDDKYLNPRSTHQMMPDLMELRSLLRQRMPLVLKEWLVTMKRKAEATEAEEREKGVVISSQSRIDRRGRRDLNRTIIHGHLVVLCANLQHREIHADIIASVLSSFMHAAAKHGSVALRDIDSSQGGRRLLVALPYLFSIMARLRVMFVEWLTFEKRPQSAISHALNAAYNAATDDDRTTKKYSWEKMGTDPQNRGRFSALSEKNEPTELNLQVMQVAAAGGVIKPLPSYLLEFESVKSGLALPLKMQGELHASLEDSRKHCSRYKLVGEDIYLNVWSHDKVLLRLNELNEKEKARQLRAFKAKVQGVTVTDAAYQAADDGDELTTNASLVRDDQRVSRSRFTRLVETVMREEDSKLYAHEKWISDLMELVPRTLLQNVQLRERDDDEEERQRAIERERQRLGYHDGGRDEAQKKRLLRFYVADTVHPEAQVVKLQGVLQTMTILEVTEDGEELDKTKQPFNSSKKKLTETYRDRYCAIMYEAYCFKDRGMVQIYQLRSEGRHYYRRLCYTTHNHLSLHYFAKTEISMDTMSYDLSELTKDVANFSAAYYKKTEIRRAIRSSQGVVAGLNDPQGDPMYRQSVVMRRRAPDLGLPDIDPERRPWERYMPQEVLHGLLPDALLENYDFYRDETGVPSDFDENLAANGGQTSAAIVTASHLTIRGYPRKNDVRVSYEDDLKREPGANVLLVEETSGSREWLSLHELFGSTGSDGTSAEATVGLQVVRHYLDKGSTNNNCRLLNLLNAKEGDELYTLSDVLLRLENLSHILVWSKLANCGTDKKTGVIQIDNVELPRMQLSFEAQQDREGKKILRSVELPHLHIFSPNTNGADLTGRKAWHAHEDVLQVLMPHESECPHAHARCTRPTLR